MTQDAIDASVFGELRATAGAEFISELVGTFFEEAPIMLADLRSASAAGDADTFRRAAHSLKSNASTFGATRLAALARDLEHGGLGAGPDQTKAALTELEVHYAVVKTILNALKD